MRTCLVIHKPHHRARLQKQLDPSPRRDHFYVVTVGTMLAGLRFDRIIVTNQAARFADPSNGGERRADNAKAWFRELERRLLPGGVMVTL